MSIDEAIGIPESYYKQRDITDLTMDMQMLEMDYQYHMDMVNSNYPYDFRMEHIECAVVVFGDLIYYEELLIKKRHC
jgi:hypothetical protein